MAVVLQMTASGKFKCLHDRETYNNYMLYFSFPEPKMFLALKTKPIKFVRRLTKIN